MLKREKGKNQVWFHFILYICCEEVSPLTAKFMQNKTC